MKIIPIEKLIVAENRQRRLFPPASISELSQSILSKGLLHPPVVRAGINETYVLVAGERRLIAIRQLQLLNDSFFCDGREILSGTVPVTLLAELSDYELEEAELEENLLREDLTPQEEAIAVARLHQLRIAQNPAQTIRATADEIHRDKAPALRNKISEQILIAQNIGNPEVAKAKTHKEAIKIIEKQKQSDFRKELAKAFNPQSSPNQLFYGDAIEEMKKFDDLVFNAIITDPPYGINAESFGEQSSAGHEYVDDKAYALKCYENLFREGFRITKASATLFAFCDIKLFFELIRLAKLHKWNAWPRPLIWNKLNGMLPVPDTGPRNTYEAILMLYKNETKTQKVGAPDVLTFSLVNAPEHGAQKPVEVLSELISRCCLPGDKILDPFAGSGSIFPAANDSNCTAVGIEISEAYAALALSKLNLTSRSNNHDRNNSSSDSELEFFINSNSGQNKL